MSSKRWPADYLGPHGPKFPILDPDDLADWRRRLDAIVIIFVAWAVGFLVGGLLWQ